LPRFIDRTPLIGLLPPFLLENIMNSKPITRSLVMDWQEAHRKASKLEDAITERIDYVLKTWFEVFGAKLEYWYFDGADEGEIGDLYRYFNDDNIYGFYVEVKGCPDEMVIIDKDGDEWGWESEIQTRWLFEEGFKEEIIQGKALYEKREKERQEAKKKSREAKKAKDDALAEAAKKKLSPEELAALKRTL